MLLYRVEAHMVYPNASVTLLEQLCSYICMLWQKLNETLNEVGTKVLKQEGITVRKFLLCFAIKCYNIATCQCTHGTMHDVLFQLLRFLLYFKMNICILL